jgi:large subunit ribosomal protein L6e
MSTTKQFGGEKREVPKPENRASKWYPAEDEKRPKKVY